MTHAGDHPDSERILRGDRFCARCGANLIGRPVEREPHYGMLIVRCPACPQVAAVQEYPPLGRWAGRLSMLVAATWLLFLFLFGLGTIGGIMGPTFGITVEAFDHNQRHVTDAYRAWQTEHHPDETRWEYTNFPTWWETEGRGTLDDAALVSDPEEILLLLIPAGITFLVGMMWSVLLIARPLRHLFIGAGAVAIVIFAVLGLVWLRIATVPPVNPDLVLWRHVYMMPVFGALAFMATVFAAGTAVGRPICRGVVRALLPPRFRGTLAFLWTATGREAPLPSVFARRARERGDAP